MLVVGDDRLFGNEQQPQLSILLVHQRPLPERLGSNDSVLVVKLGDNSGDLIDLLGGQPVHNDTGEQDKVLENLDQVLFL